MTRRKTLDITDLTGLGPDELKAFSKLYVKSVKAKKQKARLAKLQKICPGYKTFLKQFIALVKPKQFIVETKVKLVVTGNWESGLEYDLNSVELAQDTSTILHGARWTSKYTNLEANQVVQTMNKKIIAFNNRLEAACKKAPAGKNLSQAQFEDHMNDIYNELIDDYTTAMET